MNILQKRTVFFSFLFLSSMTAHASNNGSLKFVIEIPIKYSISRPASDSTIECIPVQEDESIIQKKKKRSLDGIDPSNIISKSRNREAVDVYKPESVTIVKKKAKPVTSHVLEGTSLQERQDLIQGALQVNNPHIYHYLGQLFLTREFVEDFDRQSGNTLIKLAAHLHMQQAKKDLGNSLIYGYRTKEQFIEATEWMRAVETQINPQTFYTIAKLFAEFPWIQPNNTHQTEQLYLKAWELSQ